jgi:hypothetical protein
MSESFSPTCLRAPRTTRASQKVEDSPVAQESQRDFAASARFLANKPMPAEMLPSQRIDLQIDLTLRAELSGDPVPFEASSLLQDNAPARDSAPQVVMGGADTPT